MLRLAGERGSALVATIMVMMVVVVLGITSLRLSVHTNDATSLDRMRGQSLQAADGGAAVAMKRLETNPLCDVAVSPPMDLTDGPRVLSKYQVRIDPEEGDPACLGPLRVIRSWGFAPAESERSLRHVQLTVQMVPQDGFRFTLFASGTNGIITANNTPTVDGDVYAEDLNQTHNNIDANDVITPGSIDTKNNSRYNGVLWAGGNITVRQGGQVTGSVLAAGSSAPGNVLLENGVVIGKDVRANGNIGVGSTTVIHGVTSPNNSSVPEPPILNRPQVNVATLSDPALYPDTQQFATGAALSTHLDSISGDLGGTFHVDDPTGTVNMTSGAGFPGSPFTVTDDLTIVTTGKIKLGGRNLMSVGGPWQVVFVSLNPAADAIEIEKPFTASPNLDVLLFACGPNAAGECGAGGVDIKNNTTFKGTIYADSISLKNKLTISYSSSLANNPPPIFMWDQSSIARFTVIPTMWREVIPGPPPA